MIYINSYYIFLTLPAHANFAGTLYNICHCFIHIQISIHTNTGYTNVPPCTAQNSIFTMLLYDLQSKLLVLRLSKGATLQDFQ